jgi:hypothetical protein
MTRSLSYVPPQLLRDSRSLGGRWSVMKLCWVDSQ